MNKPLKMTMKTPGREITVELPKWLERRLFSLFVSQIKKQANNKRSA